MQLKIASTKASLGANQPSLAGLSKAIKTSSKPKTDNSNNNESIDKNSETKNQAEKQGSTTLADNISSLVKNSNSRFDQVKDKVLPTDPATLANQFGYSLPGAAKNPEQNSSAASPSQSNTNGQQQGSGNASPGQGSGVVNNYYGNSSPNGGSGCSPNTGGSHCHPNTNNSNNHCPAPKPDLGHANNNNNSGNSSGSLSHQKPDLIAHNEVPKEPLKAEPKRDIVHDENRSMNA
ncbi:MAG: hypothetical protein LW817_02975 [Candidatus Caenarcaniphilales bacterium]|jgi:hypothetical protein|nr:hypothetical protein [Candidatus Caenarcaniphilales bacterium]